jgi:general secretion pathway protein K
VTSSARPDDETGYALVAAVAAMAVVALAALAIAGASQVGVIAASGEFARARAEVAADAGLAVTLHHLATLDEAALQALDGRARATDLDGAHVTVRLIDERGKVAINRAEDDTVGRMLEQAGLQGSGLDTARDSLLDWIDEDDQPRAQGGEADDYRQTGIAPRNSALLSVDELARVRGFSPALVSRLRGFVTVDRDAQPFDPAHAQPRALAAMSANADLSPAVIERQREADGQQAAIAGGDPKDLLHRPIRIAIDADVTGGGHVHHETVVVLTGKPDHPWDVHEAD